MLAEIGAGSIEELFSPIPPALRFSGLLNVPDGQTEFELQSEIEQQAAKNDGANARVCLLGGGAYDHFIPAAVDEIVSRGEFYTAYTPYQAEASQGSLQAFFEYQSLICRLTGMDVSNASLYEGATAVSEAVFMSMRVNRRSGRVVLLGSVHPEYRAVVETYLRFSETEVVVVPTPGGTVDPEALDGAMTPQTTCVVAQSPNFFGCVEDLSAVSEVAHRHGALSVVSFDPIACGLLKRPADCGADIAVAEGQALGIPLQYGGPLLGILTCRKAHMRKMPGRLIGQATDREGRDCFVLNLQAREQHIRRDKATSNICTNQGLLALRATVYLSLLGPQGMREVAELSLRKSHYLADQLTRLGGVELLFDRPFFKEFVIRLPNAAAILPRLAEAGFDAGPILARFEIPGINEPDAVLVAVTEKRTRAQLDSFVDVVSKHR